MTVAGAQGEPIRLAAVGLGRGFLLTMPALVSTPGVELVAAFDLRAESRARFAAATGGNTYESLGDLLNDPTVDAVYVATPHEFHAEHVTAAALAGKHVLVEKPMATGVKDCRDMIRAADTAGTVLVVGPSHGFDAPIKAAAAMIRARSYGPLRMLTAFNFTDYVYRPRRPSELDPARGGGVVFGQGAHQIDIARRVVADTVADITAVAGNWDAARPGDGAYTAVLRFSGGAVAALTYSGYAHYDSDELLDWVSELGHRKSRSEYGRARRALAGLSAQDEETAKFGRTLGGPQTSQAAASPEYNEHFGFLLISCERADLKVMADGIWVYGDERREFISVPPPPVARADAIQEFIAAIRGRPAIHDGHWGLATTACCAALSQSSKTGRTVTMADLEG